MSSLLIEEITSYRTTDGKLFEKLSEAEAHQKRIDLVDKITKLLGGSNSDICPDSSFSNGKGYFTISETNYNQAVDSSKELLALQNMENYSITSRAASIDQYCKSIGYIFACIAHYHDSICRVGQPYYALHFNEVDKSIDWSTYKKES